MGKIQKLGSGAKLTSAFLGKQLSRPIADQVNLRAAVTPLQTLNAPPIVTGSVEGMMKMASGAKAMYKNRKGKMSGESSLPLSAPVESMKNIETHTEDILELREVSTQELPKIREILEDLLDAFLDHTDVLESIEDIETRAENRKKDDSLRDIAAARQAVRNKGLTIPNPPQLAKSGEGKAGGVFQGLFSAIGGMTKGIGNALLKLPKPLLALLRSPLTFARFLGNIFSKLFWPITAIFGIAAAVKGAVSAYQDTGSIIEALKGALTEMVEWLIDAPLNLVKDMTAMALDFFGAKNAAKFINSLGEIDLSGTLKTVLDFIYGPMLNAASTLIKRTISSVLDDTGLGRAFSNMMTTIPEALWNVFAFIRGKIAEMAGMIPFKGEALRNKILSIGGDSPLSSPNQTQTSEMLGVMRESQHRATERSATSGAGSAAIVNAPSQTSVVNQSSSTVFGAGIPAARDNLSSVEIGARTPH